VNSLLVMKRRCVLALKRPGFSRGLVVSGFRVSSLWDSAVMTRRGFHCTEGLSHGVQRHEVDLVEVGRSVVQVAVDLGISNQLIYTWRH